MKRELKVSVDIESFPLDPISHDCRDDLVVLYLNGIPVKCGLACRSDGVDEHRRQVYEAFGLPLSE